MEKEKKMKLEELEVTSFVTDLTKEQQEQVQGGGTPLIYASAVLTTGIITSIHEQGDKRSWWHCTPGSAQC